MAAKIVGIFGLRMLGASGRERGGLRVLVEMGGILADCQACGLVATVRGRYTPSGR